MMIGRYSSNQPVVMASPGDKKRCPMGTVLTIAALLLLAPAFAPTFTYGSESAQAASPEVAVTLPPLSGLVAMLDPDVSVICLLKKGADPHHFQLRPRTIESLRQSRLLLRASIDDGDWPLPPRHANMLDLWPSLSHAWLSPLAVKHIAPKLAERLKQLHPGHASAIEQNLAAALVQIREIEQQWRQALDQVGGVIMQHPSWQQLMLDMGVPIRAVLESEHHGHESGPRVLEYALHALNEHPDTWLLADTAHSSRPLDWLARHANQQPPRLTLDPLGVCGESWLVLMQRNLALIPKPAREPQQP